MKRAVWGIFSWLIVLALAFGSALPAFAQVEETPEPMEPSLPLPMLASATQSTDTVATEEALRLWCEDHDEDGGRVTLADNITITRPLSGGYGGGYITIDTGAYCLTYDGGEICLDAFEITGQGVNNEGIPTPVVEVKDLGRIWMGNWNNMILDNKITATGAPDGTGGIALRVSIADGGVFDTGSIPNNNGLIQSFGAGAIGVEIMQPTDIHCLDVHVEGENSVAVYAPQGACLYYCRLRAAGTGAASVFGDVVLDACTALPEAAHMISRRIEALMGKSLFLPVLQNGYVFIGSMYTFLLRGSDGSLRKEAIYVDWDYDVLNGIDTSVLGTTIVPGALPTVFSGFGLEDDFPLELTVEVWDPEAPCIRDMFFSDDDDNKAVTFHFFFEYPEIALYRSADGGVTWEDYTSNPAIVWSEWGDSFTYHYDDIPEAIMFCVKVPDKGFSNTVTIKETDGVPVGDNGGDRSGTDRPGGTDNPGDDTGDDNSGGSNSGDNNGSGNIGGNTGGNNGGNTNGGVAGSEIGGNNNGSNANGDNHNGYSNGSENEGASANSGPVDGAGAGDANGDQQAPKHSDGVPLGQSDTQGKGSMNASAGETAPVVAPAFHPQATPARPFVSTQVSGLALALAGFSALSCLAALGFLNLRGLKTKL